MAEELAMGAYDPNLSLGKVIDSARAARERGVRDLARELKMSPSYLSDILKDRRCPSERHLREFARVLGLDFDELMARAGRLGEEADAYLLEHPLAGALIRNLASEKVSDESLQGLLDMLTGNTGRWA